jgi:hypothetical protein
MIDAIPLLLAPEGYQISRSVRLRGSASAYLTRTPASAGNQKTWTWSGWVKRGSIPASTQILFSSDNGTSNTTWMEFGFDSNFVFFVTSYTADVVYTSAVFRDPSAWYHVVVQFDSTQATSANRCRIYFNGVQQTLTGAGFTLNANYGVNAAQAHDIGRRNWPSGIGLYYDGYITEVNFIDGQALTPSSFGQTNYITGVWSPIKYTGTYGTNGFYLNFSDNSAATATTIGADRSGNGNNWTPNNISVTAGATYDSMLDVPTQWADGGNGRGNYATLNPLRIGSFNPTISEANLRTTSPGAAGGYMAIATMGVASGKWYFESTCILNEGTFIYPIIGIGDITDTNGAPGNTASEAGYWSNGQRYVNGATTNYGASWTTNDVIGVAFDLDSTQRTVEFFKNGVSQGVINITTNTAITFAPKIGVQGTNEAMAANFGQRPFAYTPPTGFRALNTLNLPTPTILKGNQFFDATRYTGNGTSISSTQTISGLSFQPDFVWIKDRTNGANNSWSHYLVDAVRGINSNGSAYLASNETSAETGANSGFGITALNSDGFSLKANGTLTNTNGDAYIAWTWKEGPTQGFDIVTYTGTGVAGLTVNHSLGVAPRMMIVKRRDAAGNNWNVYHAAIGNTTSLLLNDIAAQQAASAIYWNNTSPTSSVFTLGTGGNGNALNATYVAYLFSEVAGFSRFGSYTGNGSADGPFVFCGFRPRWVMFKRADAASAWVMYDTARDLFNPEQSYIQAQSSAAEAAGVAFDILANGFKIRTAGDPNVNGGTYIFAAFAATPFKNALAR